MLDVLITVDVEIWCDGWQDIDARFPDAFRRYIHGPTAGGDYGLPYQLKVLSDHGLKGVFFVEPLFAARFGLQPLTEIAGMIEAAGHEVQLHLHTEWVDEAREPLLPSVAGKRQHLRYFSPDEQAILIRKGKAMLEQAGATNVNAFRAGSFGFNRDTLHALAANGLPFDSSYNATLMGPDSGVMPGILMTDPANCDGVTEYPMTVYRDGRGLRHAQLTSCSSAELEGLLWQALEQERQAFVLLSHGFELLNTAKTRSDPVVVQRFQRLCQFLQQHRDSFRTAGFAGRDQAVAGIQHGPLTSPFHRTGMRMVEQAYRRRYG
ncbi:polysaccharide deacetylase family protein [Pseudoduganella sp. S-14]|uniref:polysaccharide deacetylase family protein n=1 Tax=Pseudoduganella sp. S-14 TaxID=3404065 RepID=UPI003CECB2A8